MNIMKTKIISIIIVLIAFIVNCNCLHSDDDTVKTPTTPRSIKPDNTTTTTEPSKATTPKPTPKPSDDKYVVAGNITSRKGDICLRYHFSLHMNLAYKGKDNKTVFYEIALPHDAVVHSDECSNDKTELFWFTFNNNTSMLNLTFEKNEASVYLASILANITLPKEVNNSRLFYNVTNPTPNFNVDKSHSYVCANNVTIKANNQSEFIFSNLSIQAFMDPKQKGAFSDEHNCQNEINDVVPIAVGAALTSLVIIVMIAYFIGRRRSRRLAYQSV